MPPLRQQRTCCVWPSLWLVGTLSSSTCSMCKGSCVSVCCTVHWLPAACVLPCRKRIKPELKPTDAEDLLFTAWCGRMIPRAFSPGLPPLVEEAKKSKDPDASAWMLTDSRLWCVARLQCQRATSNQRLLPGGRQALQHFDRQRHLQFPTSACWRLSVVRAARRPLAQSVLLLWHPFVAACLQRPAFLQPRGLHKQPQDRDSGRGF